MRRLITLVVMLTCVCSAFLPKVSGQASTEIERFSAIAVAHGEASLTAPLDIVIEE